MSDQPEKRRGRGRPEYVPSDRNRGAVQVLAANGTPHTVIARKIGIDLKTLRKAFPEELTEGYEQTKASLGAELVRQGLKGNVNAIRYWMSTQGGKQWQTTENRQFLVDTPQGEQVAALPVLVLQPVRADYVEPPKQTNGHATDARDD